MKLYSGKVPFIAEDLLRELTKDEDIEVESSEEVRLDFEAVLKEFIRRQPDHFAIVEVAGTWQWSFRWSGGAAAAEVKYSEMV